jgi:hypothetical protein
MYRASSSKVLKRLSATTNRRNFSFLPESKVASENTSELLILKNELAKTRIELDALKKETQQNENINKFVRNVLFSIAVSMGTKEYLDHQKFKNRKKMREEGTLLDNTMQPDSAVSSTSKIGPK